MRIIVGVVAIAIILWSGWWYLGATAQKTALNGWLDARSAEGWVAERSDISVAGYPNRIDATVSDLMLADPRSGWAWSAPFFQVLMLSYKPNHVIAVWPETQKVSAPDGTAEISSEVMRGSVVFVPDTDLTLDRTQIELKDVAITGEDWTAALVQGNLATRKLDAETRRAAQVPPVIERAHVDLIASFDAPWDRHAIEGVKPRLTAMRIKDIDLVWGKLRLTAEGRLTVDASGYPVGELNVQARHWREMLKVAVAAGALPRSLAQTAEDALGLVEMLSGKKDLIKVPLTFSDGLTRLGPVPIGPAPRLAAP